MFLWVVCGIIVLMTSFKADEISTTVSLKLYTLPNSEDCNVVKSEFYSLGVPVDERDCSELATLRELRELSGSDDVPFLRNSITEDVVSGREAILAFINDKYSEGAISHLM